jgi:hypothetical protein
MPGPSKSAQQEADDHRRLQSLSKCEQKASRHLDPSPRANADRADVATQALNGE